MGRSRGDVHFTNRLQLESDHTIDYIDFWYWNYPCKDILLIKKLSWIANLIEIKKCSPTTKKFIVGCNAFKPNYNYRAVPPCVLPPQT